MINNNNNNGISCLSYSEKLWEMLLPSPIIFSTLCISTDKTNLFIMSSIRLMIYIILYYTIADLINIDQYKTLKYIIITIIVINIIYLGVVTSKNTLFRVGSDKSMYDYVNQNFKS